MRNTIEDERNYDVLIEKGDYVLEEMLLKDSVT